MDAISATPGGVSARRLLIIFNPTAGLRRRRLLARTVAALATHGIAPVIRETQARGDAERFAAAAAAEGFDAVVAAGGDGTINEVINGLVSHPGRCLPLGIVPLGTANVLAHELCLPRDPVALAALLAGTPPRTIHVGRVNDRHFSMMVGVGLDALVVEHLKPRLKRWLGKGAYVIETAIQLLRLRPVRYRVVIDGRVEEAAAVVVAKGHFYGGRFVCAPEASLGDPLLHVCLFRGAGRLAALRYTVGVVLGLIGRMPDYAIVKASRVRIDAVAGGSIQADGDTITHLPLDISVAPRPLFVLAPAPQDAVTLPVVTTGDDRDRGPVGSRRYQPQPLAAGGRRRLG
ncbi:MAG: diacylglycerol kinase family lipid kinase [Azospirillaceae bacterium]|nr:diacylglycerol kinase family lipid kinase [Azospirillaceae bacterium]